MTEATKKPTAATAAKTDKPKKAAPAKTAAAAPAAKKEVKSGKKLKVTQIGSPIGRIDKQVGTLIGLGLNKRHRSKVLEDTPSVRGMIEAVKHLVVVEAA